jgi:hypothetical protein
MLLTLLADTIEPSLVPSPLSTKGNRAVAFRRVLRVQSLPQFRMTINCKAVPTLTPNYANYLIRQILRLLYLLQRQIELLRDVRLNRPVFAGGSNS